MGLKGYASSQPTREVEISDGRKFAVRGLSFVDLRTLVVRHSNEIASVFDLLVQGRTGTLEIESAAGVAAQFIEQFPALSADIIAQASGEEGSFEDALALPFPVQTDAIQQIIQLTFSTEGSVKKFIQTVSVLTASEQAKA